MRIEDEGIADKNSRESVFILTDTVGSEEGVSQFRLEADIEKVARRIETANRKTFKNDKKIGAIRMN